MSICKNEMGHNQKFTFRKQRMKRVIALNTFLLGQCVIAVYMNKYKTSPILHYETKFSREVLKSPRMSKLVD